MNYIYCLQNFLNKKIYIGKTNNPELRLKKHLTIVKNGKTIGRKTFNLIHKAIVKYGIDNFTYQVIEKFEDEQECLEAEKFWIEFLRTDVNKFGSDYGYNLTAGGDGTSGNHNPKHTPESKEKLRKANIGKKRPPKTELQLSISKKNFEIKNANPTYKIVWPSDRELISMVKSSSMRKIAKMLGVSQQAISHRFKVKKLK